MKKLNKLKFNFSNNKNKKIVLILLIYVLIFIVGVGITYAYYALSAVNDSSVAGTAGDADLSLEVVDQYPSNDENLVPQLEKGLATAISSDYSCVDGNKNTVCQVYSIKVTNTGTATVKVNGSIKFGNIDKMPNLKWRLIKDKNTYGDYNSHYASLNNARFDSDLTLRKGASKTYYMVIWIDEVDENQTDTGKYNAIINFSSSNGTGATSTVGEFNYMKDFTWQTTSDYFRADEYKEKIKNVSFVDYIDTSKSVVQWDVSEAQDNSIVAWLNNNSSEGYYDLYVGSNEDIYIKKAMVFLDGLKNVEAVDMSNLNTSMTIDMTSMFSNLGYNSSNLTLNLGEKFDTSNVTTMDSMFRSIAHSASDFTLNLGNKFDTSKVSSMGYMFYEAISVTNLDLGNKFDTSNVVNMNSMFRAVGTSHNDFTLNLGDKFDTSNVTVMVNMFWGTASSNKSFTLDLGNKFDTSKVIRMGSMFRGTCKNCEKFTLKLGNKFDMSSVTDIGCMFYWIADSDSSFELDLSKVTINFDNITSYREFLILNPSIKVYVKEDSYRDWILDKASGDNGFAGVSSDNIIVKK